MSHLQGGKVKINVKRENAFMVRFSVEDDGRGMSEQKLKEVLGQDAEPKGVGLWNINQRLKLLYGRGFISKAAKAAARGCPLIFRDKAPTRLGREQHDAGYHRG